MFIDSFTIINCGKNTNNLGVQNKWHPFLTGGEKNTLQVHTVGPCLYVLLTKRILDVYSICISERVKTYRNKNGRVFIPVFKAINPRFICLMIYTVCSLLFQNKILMEKG